MNARDLPAMSNVNLQHYWMPFTDNRRFKASPKLVVAAKDLHFTTADGRQVLDGLATLWCVNAGHCRPRIVEAIRRQAGELDFASSFALGHPLPPLEQQARREAVLAGHERDRHARLERLLDQPDLLRHRPPPAALHRGDHLDAPDLLRHSRTPRLMPRPSRYATCPVETGAAPAR
jgi:hypothetical protein